VCELEQFRLEKILKVMESCHQPNTNKSPDLLSWQIYTQIFTHTKIHQGNLLYTIWPTLEKNK